MGLLGAEMTLAQPDVPNNSHFDFVICRYDLHGSLATLVVAVMHLFNREEAVKSEIRPLACIYDRLGPSSVYSPLTVFSSYFLLSFASAGSKRGHPSWSTRSTDHQGSLAKWHLLLHCRCAVQQASSAPGSAVSFDFSLPLLCADDLPVPRRRCAGRTSPMRTAYLLRRSFWSAS